MLHAISHGLSYLLLLLCGFNSFDGDKNKANIPLGGAEGREGDGKGRKGEGVVLKEILYLGGICA